MKKFEYHKCPHNIDLDKLNKLGEEGWELAAITSSGGDFGAYHCYIFKREIIES